MELCLFKPQDRLVAVKRLRPDIVKNKEEVAGLKVSEDKGEEM